MACELLPSDRIIDIMNNHAEIKSIKRVNPEPVYNMEVEDNHNFAVNDGLIVHNCMDACRYFVKTVKIVKPKSNYKSMYE
jgi:hypothetical protein